MTSVNCIQMLPRVTVLGHFEIIIGRRELLGCTVSRNNGYTVQRSSVRCLLVRRLEDAKSRTYWAWYAVPVLMKYHRLMMYLSFLLIKVMYSVQYLFEVLAAEPPSCRNSDVIHFAFGNGDDWRRLGCCFASPLNHRITQRASHPPGRTFPSNADGSCKPLCQPPGWFYNTYYILRDDISHALGQASGSIAAIVAHAPSMESAAREVLVLVADAQSDARNVVTKWRSRVTARAI
jgi:hypothetical protein